MSDKPTEKPRGTVTHDGEIKAIAGVNKILASLDEPVLSRVVAWVIDRYGKPSTER